MEGRLGHRSREQLIRRRRTRARKLRVANLFASSWRCLQILSSSNQLTHEQSSPPPPPSLFFSHSQAWFWIIALLNSAYPDHDFTSVRPDHFIRENGVNDVLRQLSATVLELNGEGPYVFSLSFSLSRQSMMIDS
jgi:hypothetical protein